MRISYFKVFVSILFFIGLVQAQTTTPPPKGLVINRIGEPIFWTTGYWLPDKRVLYFGVTLENRTEYHARMRVHFTAYTKDATPFATCSNIAFLKRMFSVNRFFASRQLEFPFSFI